MSTTITASGLTTAEIDGFDDEPVIGVSWGAVFAGAAAAAALVADPAGARRRARASRRCRPGRRRATPRPRRRRGGGLAGLHADRRVGVRRLPCRPLARALGQRRPRRGLVPRHRARPARLGGGQPRHGGLPRLGDRRHRFGPRNQAGAEVAKGAARRPRSPAGARQATPGNDTRRCRRLVERLLRRHALSHRRAAQPADAQRRRTRAPKRCASSSTTCASARWARTTSAISARWSRAVPACTPADAEARVADTFKQASTTMVNAQIAAKTGRRRRAPGRRDQRALDVRRAACRRLLRQRRRTGRRTAARRPALSELPTTINPTRPDPFHHSPGGPRHAFHSSSPARRPAADHHPDRPVLALSTP